MTLLQFVSHDPTGDGVSPVDRLEAERMLASGSATIQSVELDFGNRWIHIATKAKDYGLLTRKASEAFLGNVRVVLDIIVRKSADPGPEEVPDGAAKQKRGFESAYHLRGAKLAAFLKSFYGHRCMLCSVSLPTEGDPFTEAHHMVPLSEGGLDRADNVAILCPNCHTLAHFGNEDAKEKHLSVFIEKNPFREK